jgi:hypothetical protein
MWLEDEHFKYIKPLLENSLVNTKSGICVEIGTFYGGSSVAISNVIRKYGAHLYTFQDPNCNKCNETLTNKSWQKLSRYVKNNPDKEHFVNGYDFNKLISVLKDYNNVTLMLEKSPPKYFFKPIVNFVYIDIFTDYVENLKQILFWLPLLSYNGTLIIGDWSSKNSDPTVQHYIEHNLNDSYEIINVVDCFIAINNRNKLPTSV